MKKFISLCLIIFIAIGSISWGYVGHQVVARIAENHLTPQAKLAVHDLLGNESIVDVASWADQARNQDDYSNTESWHYVNSSILGLTYQDFANGVKNSRKQNVYTALLKCEHELADKKTTKEKKTIALKFIIHLIGDVHQPMHISRGEDEGGNHIQLQFDGKGTNLHSVWDSGLLNVEGLSYVQMAANYDNASPEQIKQWQSDDMMKWLYESYQISSKLYLEAEKNNKLNDTYYKEHIPIVKMRLEQAGIRLAGVLNKLLQPYVATTGKVGYLKGNIADLPANKIEVADAGKYIGQKVTTTARVYKCEDFGSMILVSLGAAYPDSPLTVVLRGEAKILALSIDGKNITVTGKVIAYKGKPEIEVTDLHQITM